MIIDLSLTSLNFREDGKHNIVSEHEVLQTFVITLYNVVITCSAFNVFQAL